MLKHVFGVHVMAACIMLRLCKLLVAGVETAEMCIIKKQVTDPDWEDVTILNVLILKP